MTDKEIENLITGYKRDFFSKTGKGLKITISTRWQSFCQLAESFTIENLIELIFECTEWEKSLLTSERKDRTIVEQRQLIMFILYQNGAKMMQIAKLMNKKDHSTILQGLQNIENRLDTEPYLSAFLVEIIEYIREAKRLEREGIMK